MNPVSCEKEPIVIEAVRNGRWEEELRAHVAGCQACADAALAAGFLLEMQEADLAAVKVPSAGWMWWRAQLRAKRAAAERATQPITLVEEMAYASVVLSLIGLCIWNWRAIRAWLSTFVGAWRIDSGSLQAFALNLWANSNLLIIFSAAAFVVFLGFAAYLIWAEEK